MIGYNSVRNGNMIVMDTNLTLPPFEFDSER